MSKDEISEAAIIDLLRRKPELIDKAQAPDAPRIVLPLSMQEEIIDEWREKVRSMNQEQYLIDESTPYGLFSAKGELCHPETGEPVCVILDQREGDMNLIGEKFHYGWLPAKNGLFNDLLIEYGEGEELFRKIPKDYVYNEFTDIFDDYYRYEIEDVEWEYGDDLV